MRLRFDEVKATQAAGYLLSLAANHALNYLALIKLLYMADREAIARLGCPITTDHHVSMEHGPVTSNIYDRIKSAGGENAPSFWTTHIRKSGHSVELAADPGVTELSRAEERILREIFEAKGTKGPFDLADECHQRFPEWVDPGKSSTPIDLDNIIAALELSEDEASHVHSLVEIQRASHDLKR